MKKIAFFAVAAAMGSSLFVVSPSVAQTEFRFGIGPDGRPQVGVGDPDRERREFWRERREEERARAYEEGRRDAWRGGPRYGAYETRCRIITIQEENDWGQTVTRRIRRCD